MGTISTDRCLITGLKTTNVSGQLNAIQYKIEYNGNSFSFVFDPEVNWKAIINGKVKTMLQGMLFNNEWPIDEDTYITKTLIENIERMVDYPSSVEQKMNHFLIYCYKIGGSEYKKLKRDDSKHLAAYAKDKGELDQIFNGLLSKVYIQHVAERHLSSYQEWMFQLTEKGIEHAKDLESKQTKIGKLNFPAGNSPRIAFYYTKDDEKYGKAMERYFSDKNIQTYPLNTGNQKEESSIRSFRSIIHNEDVNYILFIKSAKSDSNVAFSNIVSMAVEAHLKERVTQTRFIYVGFVDDSPYDGQPRLTDYHNQMFDVRIIPNRDRLLIDILSDWIKRPGKEVVDQPSMIMDKINLMKWLIKQFQITQKNPVYLTFTLIKELFQSDDLLTGCLNELSSQGLIKYTTKNVGDFYAKEHSVTVMDIAVDWLNQEIKKPQKSNNAENKSNSYDFPRIKFNEAEGRWMQILYEKFLKREKVDLAIEFPQRWKDFPEGFDPEQIDSRLVYGGDRITILGIWHIAPQSELIEKFDAVIRAIRLILEEGKGQQSIRSSDIVLKDPSVKESDVCLVIELFSVTGGFMNSWGTNNPPNDSCHLIVGTKEARNRYKNYKGLNRLVYELYDDQKARSPNIVDAIINRDDKNIHNKSKIKLRDTDVDPVLGVVELAEDMASIIKDMPNEQGKMIGVFGKWGRGKSFFIKELWKAINRKDATDPKIYLRVDYHAWKYQDTPASWAYLYELFTSAYNPKPVSKFHFASYVIYYFNLITLNLKRLGWYEILKFLVPIIISVFMCVGFWRWGNFINSFVPFIGIPITFATMFAFLDKIKNEYSAEAVRLIKKYSLKHSFKDTMGIQAEIQKELITLFEVWISEALINKKKIILFVEDVDRCSEDKIIQIIDALRIMLEDPQISKRLIIVAAIDERVLKRAIKSKYADLVKLDSCENFIEGETSKYFDKLNVLTNEYLDKLFISGIKLGDLSSKERIDFFDTLIKEDKKLNKQEKSPLAKDEKALQKDQMDVNVQTEVNVGILVDSFNKAESYSSNTKSRGTESEELEKLSDLKLTEEEVVVLKKHLENWQHITPRKIRVFYYRYLLAKNLMLSKYKSLNKKNVWRGSDLCDIFIGELIRYSELHDPEQISMDKKMSLIKINEPSENEQFKKFKIENSDVFELLTVLELVIAY